MITGGIDAHHHFWRYTPKEFDWIDEDMSVLRRDFMPNDLELEIRSAGVQSVISVQARQSLEETHFLLDLAGQHEFVSGVVGWVPLSSKRVEEDLRALCQQPKFRAVRHALQSEVDEFYMLREDFNLGIRLLKDLELAYDILIYERQLPQTIAFVDLHPEQVFVLDHMAKPRIKEGLLQPWARNIKELAKRENVFCKLSGIATEAHITAWTQQQLVVYFDAVLAAFGSRRVLFGSDWPVCLAASDYARWHALVREQITSYSLSEQKDIMGENVRRIYGLNS